MTVAKAESLKWTRTCTRCGKKMVGVASNKKLCDSCLRIRQIEHDRKKAQNNKLEVVERAKPKHAPEDSLQNDVREAERLGVSYGKYRAWKDGRMLETAIRRVGNEYADLLFEHDQQCREAEKQCEQLAAERMRKS